MSYGRIFSLWRTAAGPHWDAYVDHAFVRGLADGSLPREAFLHYLVQDYLFLVQFARAWSLAVTKAETMEEMRHCAATARALLEDELALHRGICAEAGIDLAALDAAEEHPATIAYTRYVLDAGHAGDFAELLAALVPCVLGYGEIGRRLCADRRDTPYRDWIETYGGDEYQALCARVGALVDAAVTRRLGRVPQDAPRWMALCRRFTTATRLEAGFWQMGLVP
ncbi:thiaminase II [Limimaricola sp.]|uniref:thiaminase II n=1 Tax=Limimaricola sp. TaxID=2211665 RepID=UPI004059F629